MHQQSPNQLTLHFYYASSNPTISVPHHSEICSRRYKLIENQLRIRKLTPRECYRLMGFGDQAFDLAQPNQSNSSLYHQAGDSIVVNVLMELLRSLI
jgi:site-specific DNA-cytosine methylase